jgi:hypothetical protein
MNRSKFYSFGTCPDEIIKTACNKQCPNGYSMKIVDPEEWTLIANAVNKGIDSHLEAITNRSTFNNGTCLVHPDELHVLLRRFIDWDNEKALDLRTCILSTLDIEEV